jgi:hypothetical protein
MGRLAMLAKNLSLLGAVAMTLGGCSLLVSTNGFDDQTDTPLDAGSDVAAADVSTADASDVFAPFDAWIEDSSLDAAEADSSCPEGGASMAQGGSGY